MNSQPYCILRLKLLFDMIKTSWRLILTGCSSIQKPWKHIGEKTQPRNSSWVGSSGDNYAKAAKRVLQPFTHLLRTTSVYSLQVSNTCPCIEISKWLLAIDWAWPFEELDGDLENIESFVISYKSFIKLLHFFTQSLLEIVESWLILRC